MNLNRYWARFTGGDQGSLNELATGGTFSLMDGNLTVPVRYPPPILCTDNAAMIGAAAHQRFLAGQKAGLDLDVVPSLQLQ